MTLKTKLLISAVVFYTLTSSIMLVSLWKMHRTSYERINEAKDFQRLDSIINSNAGQNAQIKKQQEDILGKLISIQNEKAHIIEKYHEKITIIDNTRIDNPVRYGDSLFNVLEQRNASGYFNPPAIKVD